MPDAPHDPIADDVEIDELWAAHYEKRTQLTVQPDIGFFRKYWPAVVILLGFAGLAWLAASVAWGGRP